MTYPGPEYLRTGEYGECEHGVPESFDCTDCMARSMRLAEEEHEAILDYIEAGLRRALAEEDVEVCKDIVREVLAYLEAE